MPHNEATLRNVKKAREVVERIRNPMDPIEQAFLERIQADDDPRLTQGIYADWLEEQGDPRAGPYRKYLAVMAEFQEGESYIFANMWEMPIRSPWRELEEAIPSPDERIKWINLSRIPVCSSRLNEFAGTVWNWKRRRPAMKW